MKQIEVVPYMWCGILFHPSCFTVSKAHGLPGHHQTICKILVIYVRGSIYSHVYSNGDFLHNCTLSTGTAGLLTLERQCKYQGGSRRVSV